MASLTIRNLDDETRDALKALACNHGRSMEAEVRHILVEATRRKAVRPMTPEQMRLRLKAIMDEAGGGLKPGELELPPRDTQLHSRIQLD